MNYNEPRWLVKRRELYRKYIGSDFLFSIKKPLKQKITRSKNTRIVTIYEMLEKDQQFVKRCFERLKTDICTYFSYLAANFNECNFIFIDKNKRAELGIISSGNLSLNFIFVGQGSTLRLFNSIASDSVAQNLIKMEENSSVHMGVMKHRGVFSYLNCEAEIGTNASLNASYCWNGSGIKRNTVKLVGAESSVKQIEFSMSGNQTTNMLDSNIIHSANNTSSILLMRGVVEDSSSTEHIAKVSVERNARGSDSSMKQEILLLDEDAKANARPILETKNDAIHCSHSAAVKPLEKEKLFYLQTRGVERELAKTTMISGFLWNTINKIEDKELRNSFKPPFMYD